MGRKRKSIDTEEKIRRKIRRLEGKLNKKKKYKRMIIESSDDNSDDPDIMDYEQRPHTPYSRTPSPPSYSPLTVASMPRSPQPGTSTAPPADSQVALGEHIAMDSNNIEESKLDPELQDEILLLLGEAPKNDVTFGKPIHKDIASRWQEILAKGLSKEIKSKILEEYSIPSNCELLLAPLLNPEAKAALSEPRVRRDSTLMIKQKQLGTALSALAQAMDMVINKETSAQRILKPISDACRLLCDIHFHDTRTRRNLITTTTNSNLKEMIVESIRDKYLFGENLSEKLKAAKTIQQSGESLKNKKPTSLFNKNNFISQNNSNLNSQTFYRKTRNRPAEQERARAARSYSGQQRRTTRGRESPRRTSGTSHSRTTRRK